MRTIFKYQVQIGDLQTIQMPEGAIPLSAQMQGRMLCIWADVHTEHPLVERRFFVAGTGHPLEFAQGRCVFEPPPRFLGTVQIEDLGLVFHVFDLGETGAHEKMAHHHCGVSH